MQLKTETGGLCGGGDGELGGAVNLSDRNLVTFGAFLAFLGIAGSGGGVSSSVFRRVLDNPLRKAKSPLHCKLNNVT